MREESIVSICLTLSFYKKFREFSTKTRYDLHKYIYNLANLYSKLNYYFAEI